MSYNHATLKKNLERLLKERALRIVDLESRAKKGRFIHNILNGKTINPGIEIIKSLADALNVDIEEFLVDIDNQENANSELLLDSCIKVINEIIPLIEKYNIKVNNIFSCIKEAYSYSKDLNLAKADPNFIKWFIKQNYN